MPPKRTNKSNPSGEETAPRRSTRERKPVELADGVINESLPKNKTQTPAKRTPAKGTPAEGTPVEKAPTEKSPVIETPSKRLATKTPDEPTPINKPSAKKPSARKAAAKVPEEKTPVESEEPPSAEELPRRNSDNDGDAGADEQAEDGGSEQSEEQIETQVMESPRRGNRKRKASLASGPADEVEKDHMELLDASIAAFGDDEAENWLSWIELESDPVSTQNSPEFSPHLPG
jgi:hypothetical protein